MKSEFFKKPESVGHVRWGGAKTIQIMRHYLDPSATSPVSSVDEQRGVKLLVWSVYAHPLAWLILLYGYFLRARLALGFWPSPGHPDPKTLEFDIHAGFIWLLGAVLPVWLVTVFVFIMLRWRRIIRARSERLGLLMYMVGFSAALTVANQDPGGVMNWFAD